jgi:hypothetical protein
MPDLLIKKRQALAFGLIWLCGAALAQSPAVGAAKDAPAFEVIKLDREGPLTAVAVKAQLNHPRLELVLAMAGDAAPSADRADRADRAAWRLDTTSQAARKHGLAVAMNASFFGVTEKKPWQGKSISYFVGNPGYPVGWHVSGGVVHSKPQSDKLRATLLLPKQGRATIKGDLAELPGPPSLYQLVVSGNAMLLAKGEILVADPGARAPRSVVGLSADGLTFFLLAINGRSAASRGATLAEAAKLLQELGASDALNLDGGGSTAMVLQDSATGVHFLANQPSDPSSWGVSGALERAVVDVIGIRLR